MWKLFSGRRTTKLWKCKLSVSSIICIHYIYGTITGNHKSKNHFRLFLTYMKIKERDNSKGQSRSPRNEAKAMQIQKRNVRNGKHFDVISKEESKATKQ